MDVNTARELSKLASKQIELASLYAKKRREAGDLKSDIEIMVTANLSNIRGAKKNVGYDMAVLMLLEIRPEFKETYKNYRAAEADYKGLEKLIEAHQTKISLEQSIMKYILQGERHG